VASRQIQIPNASFTPRWYQRPFMLHFTANGHDGRGRTAVEVDHRRAGKDIMGLHTLNICAHRRRGAYWHTFPTFEQGRKAIWEGFTKEGERTIDSVFPRELIRRKDNQSMMIELKCGSLYRIMGMDKIENVGAGPVGVLHSEYSVAKPKAADMIAPMLRENDGWEAYVYTPRGNNHGKKLFDRMNIAAKADPVRYFCALHTLFDTRAYDPDKTLAEERAKGRPEALIRQEYLCDWTAANVGAVWGDLVEVLEKSGALADFDHPTDRVFTTWDLGGAGARGDSTAFWIWAATDGGVDLIDYYEGHGKSLSHYFDEVEKRRCDLGVRYVKHWLPHDARAKALGTGLSVLEQCATQWGNGMVAIYPEMGLLDGIQAGRWLLQQKVRIHPRCVDGTEAIKAYHYNWDDDRKTFSNVPEHDWASHGSDAFRGLALVSRFSDFITRKSTPKTGPYSGGAHREISLDELWQDHDREK
jgi:phage terminase large subunit